MSERSSIFISHLTANFLGEHEAVMPWVLQYFAHLLSEFGHEGKNPRIIKNLVRAIHVGVDWVQERGFPGS
jgi:hypothetical protein